MIVDGEMKILPTDPPAVALAGSISGDPMTGALEAAELLDVDVDEFTRTLALVTSHGFGWLQCRDAIEAETTQHAAHSGGGYAKIAGDMTAGEALTPQGLDGGDRLRWRRLAHPIRPRRTILKTGQTFPAEPVEPLPGRPRADACGSCGGLRRLPALDLPHKSLSTKRRQSGILVDVRIPGLSRPM